MATQRNLSSSTMWALETDLRLSALVQASLPVAISLALACPILSKAQSLVQAPRDSCPPCSSTALMLDSLQQSCPTFASSILQWSIRAIVPGYDGGKHSPQTPRLLPCHSLYFSHTPDVCKHSPLHTCCSWQLEHYLTSPSNSWFLHFLPFQLLQDACTFPPAK